MPKKSEERVRIGIGGWVYEPWRGTFYPKGLAQRRELEFASRQVTSIEINGTYYGSQKPESFARWHDETPDDFVFAVKGPRFATNRRVLAEAGPSIERFFESGVMRLGAKLGPVNWQFMATKKFDAEDFEAFLSLLPKRVDGHSVRHAVELRHDSFRSPDAVALARKHGVAIVLAVDSNFPEIADLTAPFVYARLMGASETEPRGYGNDALELWAGRARAWLKGERPDGLAPVVGGGHDGKSRDVFLYFISGFKVHNPAAATALIERFG